MIRVEGPDPTAMIARARHHLQIVVPLLEEAALCLVLKCPLSRDHHEHVLSQRRRGGESLSTVLARWACPTSHIHSTAGTDYRPRCWLTSTQPTS
jgi:hypothetical protein